MKNYIGKKIRGFKFDNRKHNMRFLSIAYWAYEGKVGKIVYQNENFVTVNFEPESLNYPISLIDQHIIIQYTHAELVEKLGHDFEIIK